MPSVLLVEDDALIARAIRISLNCEGYRTEIRETNAAARQAVAAQAYDAVILDFNLPDGDCCELCGEIRVRHPDLPIVVITASVEEDAAVRTLTMGADDHVRKPFGVREFVARLDRLLNRCRHRADSIFCGRVRIARSWRQAYVGETQIHLGRKEFDILALLIERQGEIVSRSELLDAIDEEAELFDRTIDSHLSHLRRKLRLAGEAGVAITAIYGYGYRLESA